MRTPAETWSRRIIACAFLMLTVQRPACCQGLAILAGGLVDSATGQLTADQTILVDAGKIIAIGRKLPIPKGAKVIDLSKYTVLPGLMDAHTHLCANVDARWDLGDFWIMAMQRRSGYRALLGAANAREMLLSVSRPFGMSATQVITSMWT